MASVIYYKLKNAIQQHQVHFEGSVISIGDVKRLIAQKQGLGPDGALELTLSDPNTHDEYSDEAKVIPRNTLVLVKRAPATKLKPLLGGGGDSTAAASQQQQQTSSSQAAAHNGDGSQQPQQHHPPTADFGGDFYSDQPTAAVVGEDETKALQSLLHGTAATWQREVRQGALRGRGRGRGRGGVPFEYRCPRCEAVGAHWLQDCPTQGDPAYDRKRVRPPVGIPMTRLARSQDGGLVLPDGQTGTLVANEDAFAREILGFGLMQGHQQENGGHGEQQQQQQGTAAVEQQQPVLALDNKPAGEENAAITTAAGAVTGGVSAPLQNLGGVLSAPPQPPPPAPLSAGVVAPPTQSAPKLAGEEELSAGAPAMPGAAFFDVMMRASMLPRGPPAFLERCFGGAEPLSRREFERGQDEYRFRFNMRPLRRQPDRQRERTPREEKEGEERPKSRKRSRSRSRTRSKSRRRSRSRERSSRSHRRTRSRSRSRSRSARDKHRRKREEESKSRRRERSRDRSRDRRRGSTVERERGSKGEGTQKSKSKHKEDKDVEKQKERTKEKDDVAVNGESRDVAAGPATREKEDAVAAVPKLERSPPSQDNPAAEGEPSRSSREAQPPAQPLIDADHGMPEVDYDESDDEDQTKRRSPRDSTAAEMHDKDSSLSPPREGKPKTGDAAKGDAGKAHPSSDTRGTSGKEEEKKERRDRHRDGAASKEKKERRRDSRERTTTREKGENRGKTVGGGRSSGKVVEDDAIGDRKEYARDKEQRGNGKERDRDRDRDRRRDDKERHRSKDKDKDKDKDTKRRKESRTSRDRGGDKERHRKEKERKRSRSRDRDRDKERSRKRTR